MGRARGATKPLELSLAIEDEVQDERLAEADAPRIGLQSVRHWPPIMSRHRSTVACARELLRVTWSWQDRSQAKRRRRPANEATERLQ